MKDLEKEISNALKHYKNLASMYEPRKQVIYDLDLDGSLKAMSVEYWTAKWILFHTKAYMESLKETPQRIE